MQRDLFGNEIEEEPPPEPSRPSKPAEQPKPSAPAESAPVRIRKFTFWKEGNVTTIWHDE